MNLVLCHEGQQGEALLSNRDVPLTLQHHVRFISDYGSLSQRR